MDSRNRPKHDQCNLGPIWAAADELLEGARNDPISLADILDKWRTSPYGVREGLLPPLVLAYMLSRVDRLAIYLDGAFRPSLDDFLVDRMHQEADAVQNSADGLWQTENPRS